MSTPDYAVLDSGVVELPAGTSGMAAVTVARECAAQAEYVLRRGFGTTGRGDVRWKGHRDPVTVTDTAAEEAVLSILRREFPRHAILAEESSATAERTGWMWVVDPLDGTRNFTNHIPHFAFNIALCLDGAPVLGLTLDPLRNEEFFAVRGHGATLNGVPLQASTAQRLPDAIVSADMGYDDADAARQLDILRGLWPGVQAIRICGSAALDLAYTASGRWDLFMHQSLSPWDVAPGILLVQEAGGHRHRRGRRADADRQRHGGGGRRRGARSVLRARGGGGGQGVIEPSQPIAMPITATVSSQRCQTRRRSVMPKKRTPIIVRASTMATAPDGMIHSARSRSTLAEATAITMYAPTAPQATGTA